MKEKYEWYDEIPDKDIIQAFKEAEEISFSARRFNAIQYRKISFGDFGVWFPLIRILPLLGITPRMLRPVFTILPQKILTKRSFPANFNWFGANKNTTKLVGYYPPKNVVNYEELGSFPLNDIPFRRLSVILNKPIKVLREDGYTGAHYHLFTVYPDGQVIGGADASS